MILEIEPLIFKIEPLNSEEHIRSDFRCGKDTLDNYIPNLAPQDLKRNTARVFVAIKKSDNGPKRTVLGYYSLSSYIINPKELDETFAKRLPRYDQLPATLLGRLAVDCTQQGKKLGEALLYNALKKSLAGSEHIASIGLIAEAKDEKAAQFYLKYGFQRFKNSPIKLFLPTKFIKNILPKDETEW